jgi:hypothetical protein
VSKSVAPVPSAMQGKSNPAPLDSNSQGSDAPSGVPQAPSRLPQVDNPFDPELFNRLTSESQP